MVRADLVRDVQLLCRFRAKITWPSVYDPFLGAVKGRCWSKNCFAHFSIHSFHFIFIMISIKNMASSNAVKSCTHIEDIQMKKRTEAF